MFSGLASNGILIMLGASGFFSAFDCLNKYLVGSFAPGEIAFVRFAFGALILSPSLIRQRPWRDRHEFLFLLLRGVLGAVAFYAMIRAFQTSALSVTMVLFWTNPMWALFLGACFLAERITWKRGLCVGVALFGTTVLFNPWEGGIAVGHLYGLIAGMLVGAGSVLIRYLRARHDARVIYGFHCLVGALFWGPLAIGNIHVPTMSKFMLLLISAAVGLLAQLTMNYGFRFIRAAEGSTIIMAELIMTSTVGILVFHEPLTLRFIVGAIAILLSGIYLGLATNEARRDAREAVSG